MKKYFWIACIVIVCIFFAKTYFAPSQNTVSETSPSSFVTTNTLSINDASFEIALARTALEQEKGLGNVNSIPADAGMLFVFAKPDKYGFWMKDTLIPLDMIWIDAEKRVVHIEKDVRPESYPKIFTPAIPALYVLELNAGEVEKNNINLGDFTDFSI